MHSLKYVCLRCKQKLPLAKKGDLESLQEKHETCDEEPWPEKRREWAKWTLMSKEQHDRWKAWTTTINERRQPGNGQREKKAYWSWRKIYESLYPNTADFPAACLGGEQLGDTNQTTSKAKETSVDTRSREEVQQTPVTNTGVPSKLPTGPAFLRNNDPVWFVSPLSADLRVGQQQCPETESSVSWLETSTGPGSMAYSSTSGTTDNLIPPTPSHTSFSNGPSADWLYIGDSHLYLGERVEGIYDENLFSQDDPILGVSGVRDEEDS